MIFTAFAVDINLQNERIFNYEEKTNSYGNGSDYTAWDNGICSSELV